MRFKTQLLVLAITLLIMPIVGSAHPTTRKVSPMDGEVFATCPEAFYVRFTQKHKLKQFILSDSKGNTIDIGFKPKTITKWEHRVQLPCLPAGQYTISYMVKGRDLHEITKKISFVVQ